MFFLLFYPHFSFALVKCEYQMQTIDESLLFGVSALHNRDEQQRTTIFAQELLP